MRKIAQQIEHEILLKRDARISQGLTGCKENSKIGKWYAEKMYKNDASNTGKWSQNDENMSGKK